MELFQKEEIQRTDYVPDCLVMIRPTDFGFNEQTAADNLFQKHIKLSHKEILRRAQKEFDDYVAMLREKGIKVIVLDKNRIPELAEVQMPDGVFPNWFSTEPNGMLIVYKMHTQLRENEKALLKYLETALLDEGYQINGIISIGSAFDPRGRSLEGTGVMVFDRHNKIVFSGISQRSNSDYFKTACRLLGYRGINYETEMSNGQAFYHSDLYFCIGQKFAVVCFEAINEDKRNVIKQELLSLGKEIIEISLEQVEKHFCGNILEVKSKRDEKRYVVMSRKAYKGFTEEQLSKLSKYGEILSAELEIIEAVGGGSAKCMLTECLLPEVPDKKLADADVHQITSGTADGYTEDGSK